MMNYILKLNKVDTNAMIFVYGLNMLSNIVYVYLLWRPEFFLFDKPVFLLINSFVCGVSFVMNAILIEGIVFKKRTIWRMKYLLLYGIMHIGSFIVGVVYIAIYGGFWRSGFLSLRMEILIVVIYLRRYFFLRTLVSLTDDDEILIKEGYQRTKK